MSQTPNASTAAPNVVANPQGASPTTPEPRADFTPPQGHRLVSDADWGAYERNQQRIKGYEQFVGKLAPLGIKGDKDIERLSKTIKALTSPEDDGDPKVGQDGGGTFTRAELEKLMNDRFDGFKSQTRAELAHERAIEAQNSHIEKAIAPLLEGIADEFDRDVLRDAIQRRIEQARELYPQDHPLHAQDFRPMTEAQVQAAIKAFTDKKTQAKAAALAAKGDKVRAASPKPTPSQTAGAPGNLGGQTEVEPKTTRSILERIAAEQGIQS